jgi:hypothetical protein
MWSEVAEFVETSVENWGEVDEAVFVALESSVELKQWLSEHGMLHTSAEMRAVLRHDLLSYSVGVKANKSFHSESGVFVGVEVDGVCKMALGYRCCKDDSCQFGSACGAEGCVSAQQRVKAMSLLQKHFPIALRKCAVKQGAERKEVESFWKRAMKEAQDEGVCVERSVCCRLVSVCVPLDRNGNLERFVPPVLPCWLQRQDGSVALAAFTDKDRRCRHREELLQPGLSPSCSHGPDVVALPSDFLCSECVWHFRHLNIRTCDNAAAWCRRMG